MIIKLVIMMRLMVPMPIISDGIMLPLWKCLTVSEAEVPDVFEVADDLL